VAESKGKDVVLALWLPFLTLYRGRYLSVNFPSPLSESVHLLQERLLSGKMERRLDMHHREDTRQLPCDQAESNFTDGSGL
jgi:hypothetical protein